MAKKELICRVHLRNPFEEVLTGCYLTLEGQAMGNERVKVPDLKPDEEYKLKMSLNPRKSGVKTILVDLDSNQIQDIKGFYEISVEAEGSGEEEEFTPLKTNEISIWP